MQKTMMIIVSATAVLLAGATAQAGTWRGASDVGAAAQNYTPIRPAACQGWGPFCRPGFTRVCGRWRCWCRPCF
jgi:hypothetical protein